MGEKAQAKVLFRQAEKLIPLQKKMDKTKPGDWLAYNKEKGQTFQQYINSRPVLPRGRREIIYIQPIGKFTKDQKKIIRLTAEFIKLYYGLDVKIKKSFTFNLLPQEAERLQPGSKDVKQISSKYILYDVLMKYRPDDAAAYLGLTTADLWPGKKNFNFVFGQASLKDRVGVWSLYRNGDPKTEFSLVLLRTIKTAVHEIAHMFSIKHCIAYQCCLNGSNSREESDSRPLWLCPEDLTKVLLFSKLNMVERFKTLKDFCKKNGLKKEAKYYSKAIKIIKK